MVIIQLCWGGPFGEWCAVLVSARCVWGVLVLRGAMWCCALWVEQVPHVSLWSRLRSGTGQLEFGGWRKNYTPPAKAVGWPSNPWPLPMPYNCALFCGSRLFAHFHWIWAWMNQTLWTLIPPPPQVVLPSNVIVCTPAGLSDISILLAIDPLRKSRDQGHLFLSRTSHEWHLLGRK